MRRIPFIWTENDQYTLELKYGRRAWSTDVLLNIEDWPYSLGKARRIFKESSLDFSLPRIGSCFTEPFIHETDWGNHQLETTAFYSADSPPTDFGYSFLGFVIRRHKSLPVEVALRGSFSGDTPSAFCYKITLGLTYSGTDESFQPTYPDFGIKEMLLYKCGRVVDERPMHLKFPLLTRVYDAEISILADASNHSSGLSAPDMKIKDPRLEELAHTFYLAISARFNAL